MDPPQRSAQLTPINRDIFSTGAIVNVDEEIRTGRSSGKGVAYVTAVNEERRTCDVRYPALNFTSPNVAEHRLHPYSLADFNTARGGRRTRRRLLPDDNQPARSLTPGNRGRTSPTTVMETIEASRYWKATKDLPFEPICEYLFDGRKNLEQGWIRQRVANENNRPTPKSKNHLNTPEKKVIQEMYGKAKQITPSRRPPKSNPLSDLAFGFGKTKRTIIGTEKRYLEQKMDSSRKKRSDSGVSVFDTGEAGDRKRTSVYTPLDYFKRYQRLNSTENFLTDAELRERFEALTPTQQLFYTQGAQGLRGIAARSSEDIGRILRNTNGAITWRDLASKLAGDGVPVANKDTIRKFVMSKADSAYRSTASRPMLTEACKRTRMKWAIGFLILYRGGQMVHQKVQIVHVQSDEKWFYSLVIRNNLKYVPFFGCCPLVHSIHHKSHIDKVLVIAMTAFAPTDNNFRLGGKAYKVLLERAGGMVEAQKDSYKRVYKPDGSYHYPTIPENLLREKGKEYFKDFEITGADEFKKGKPKYSLKKMYEDFGMEKLDDLARRVETETGKKVVLIGQEDNAGPHQQKKYRDYLETEFNKRGWQIRLQPPNSPITNVQDLGLFSAMAKAVNRIQGHSFGSHYLDGDDLWNTVVQAWNEMPLDTISRLYCLCAQIANAIHESNGGDAFMDSQKNLHCGIRKIYHPIFQEGSEEPVGIECLENTAVDVFDKDEKLLQYSTPDVTEDFKRNGGHRMTTAEDDDELVDCTGDSKYIPARHLSMELFDAFVDAADPSHPDFEYFFGFTDHDDEFELEWNQSEQITRAEALGALGAQNAAE